MKDEKNMFIEFFKTKKPITFIEVKEGKLGIETYASVELKKFPKPYKKQLISFLEGVVKELQEKENNKKCRN